MGVREIGVNVAEGLDHGVVESVDVVETKLAKAEYLAWPQWGLDGIEVGCVTVPPNYLVRGQRREE